MSNTTTKQIGRPKKAVKREVSAVNISKQSRKQLNELASNDRRSLANYLEVLIEREHALVFPKNVKVLGRNKVTPTKPKT